MSWFTDDDDNNYIITITKVGSKGEVLKLTKIDIRPGMLDEKKLIAWKKFNSKTKFTKMTQWISREIIPASSDIKGLYKYKVTDGSRHFIVDSLASGSIANETIIMAKIMFEEEATREME